MQRNADLIRKFYSSFQARDSDGMNACYREDIVFSDPVFGTLNGEAVTCMWRMLCERGKDLDIEFGNVHADDEQGSAHWEAWYTFSKSGRRVHNVIDASFLFQGGKIIRHTDKFSLWRWSAQATGLPGVFLGWTPFMQSAIRKQARQGLDKFMQHS